MRGLDNRVVIVTGGAGGIGGATCRRFAEEGARVCVYDLNADGAEQTARALRDGGARAEAAAVDITDHAAVSAAVAATEQSMGPVDVLVNNAGHDEFRPFLASEDAAFITGQVLSVSGGLTMNG